MDPELSTRDAYEEFICLYSQHRGQVFAFIHSLLSNRADAEDVLQKASLIMWRKFEQYDRTKAFLPWANGLARFEVLNFLRSSPGRKLQFDYELVSRLATLREAESADSTGRLEALSKCSESLKTDERELLEWVYKRDRRVLDFAIATGYAPQTVYNRLAAIKRKLERCIEFRLVSGTHP